MTLCILWRDQNTIHMASDSRITLHGGSSADVAIKVLCVPCRIHWPTTETERGEYLFDLGLAVAGNHTNSFVIKETLSEVLKNMQAAPGYTEISMDKIAKIWSVAYETLSREICKTALAEKGIAEIHIAGFCPKQGKYRVFKFSTDKLDNTHSYTEVLLKEGEFSLSGSGKERANELLEKRNDPRKVVIDIAADKNYESIGGPLQYGYFTDKKFKVFANCKLDNGDVIYERGGLNINDENFMNAHDDLFISMPLLDFIKQDK